MTTQKAKRNRKHVKLCLIGSGVCPSKAELNLVFLENLNTVVATFQIKRKHKCSYCEI